MKPAQPVQRPPRTPLYADWLLPIYAVLLGLGTCLFLSIQDTRQIQRGPAFFGGWLVGLILPRIWNHRFRVLGFVPYMAMILAVWNVLAIPAADAPLWAIAGSATLSGFGAGAILRYRDRFRDKQAHFFALAILAAALGLGLVAMFHPSMAATYEAVFLALGPILVMLSVVFLLRPMIELFFEVTFRPIYHVSAIGPGVDKVPLTGPVIVIANHAQWFDPLFLAKFIPRETTPMMTASFYDLPILRWLMVRVFHTIRVEDKPVRREVPEIQEALKALAAGKCLVIFPEGYLRRGEEVPLRRFGRGIWQILQACPDVPVVACWIEGSWGSYFSHYNGPPTKNKRFDKNRRITVGVLEPIQVPQELLADHLKTRLFLMKKVLEARKLLGLPDVPPPELKSSGEVEQLS